MSTLNSKWLLAAVVYKNNERHGTIMRVEGDKVTITGRYLDGLQIMSAKMLDDNDQGFELRKPYAKHVKYLKR